MPVALTVLALFCGALLLWWHPKQPFPEISRSWGAIFLILAGFGLLADSGPRETTLAAHGWATTAIGGAGLVVGLWQMGRAQRDVLVAPFASVLLAGGMIALLADQWSAMSGLEQAMAGLLGVIVLLGVLYIVFKGLFVGELRHAWSQAALRQLEHGILDGERGAAAFFERAWEERISPLNAMSYAALVRIHEHLGDAEAAAEWSVRLEDQGGWSVVEPSWLEAIDLRLGALGGSSGEES